jgi:multidrug efflux pump
MSEPTADKPASAAHNAAAAEADHAPGGGAPSGISAPFIARPIATSLLALAIFLASALAYSLLPISSLPQVDFPVIQVTTRLPGANADTMARLVTAPLERQLGQIPSLENMSSTSSEGLSQITLRFMLNRDINAAGQDVQSAISAAGGSLPQNLPYPPVYAKVNPSDPPIVTIALTSQSVALERLSDFADTLLAPRLSQVAGVGRVTVQGNIRPAIRIQANPLQLASLGIALETMRSAIANANVTGSKGLISGPEKSYIVGANDQLESARAYEDVVVAYRNKAPVLLRDVATVVAGLENERVAARYNGTPAVVIDVQRQPSANIVGTVDELKKILPKLVDALPAGVKLDIVADRTGTIRASVEEVQFTLVLSVALVVMVVLLFLRTFSATIVAGITLPLSLMAAFGVMYYAGFSLNNLSLMALTIATGFVVDDAIVMIENVMRYIEKGEKPLAAAYKGAGEIGFTIVSLTLSLIAVFIPLLFMEGIVGRLFREFALTLTAAVVTSMIVALTLTPMMAARLLRAPRHGEAAPWYSRAFEAPFDALLSVYRVTLDRALNARRLMLLVAAATFVLTVVLYIAIPKGFLPDQDTGFLTAETVAAPGVSFERINALQAEVERIVRRDPDVLGVVSVIGVGTTNATPNAAHLALTLKPKNERKATAPEILQRLTQATADFPGLRTTFQIVQDIQIGTARSRTQYQYVIVGLDREGFSGWAKKLEAELSRDRRLIHVASDLQEDGNAVLIKTDRVIAGRLGVTMQALNDTLYDAFGQRQISTIYGQSNQYRVVLEVDPAFQTDTAALGSIYVPGTAISNSTSGNASTGNATASGSTNASITATAASGTGVGSQVPLSSFSVIERAIAPLSVNHVQQYPAATISFDVAPGFSLDAAVQAVTDAQARIALPSSIVGSYTGAAAEFNASLANQPLLILAAVVTIYIILGVLYESFIHPFTILTTLPSAGIGALLALEILGMEFSFIALIGIILLMGIVKKNAIIMIDFALDAERTRGLAPFEAIREACLLRFRPIMMTTVAALLGALPLVIGSGPGSELRLPLGVTIIGGLLLSQLLTLYTTPVIYLAMDGLKRRLERRFGFDEPNCPPPALRPEPGLPDPGPRGGSPRGTGGGGAVVLLPLLGTPPLPMLPPRADWLLLPSPAESQALPSPDEPLALPPPDKPVS